MRIAMITHFPEDLANPRGGVATATVALLRGLTRHDELDLHVLSIVPGRAEPYEVDDPRCTVHPIPPNGRMPGFLANVTVRRRHIARILEGLTPDVVHAQGYACYVDPRRWPSVLTVHGIQELDLLYSDRPLRRLRSWFTAVTERHYRRQYRHIICIADYVARQLQGQLAGSHYSIPNAVEEVFFNVRRKPDPGRILYVGLIIPRKNIEALVEMAGILRQTVPDFSLRFIGPIDDSAYLERQRRRCRALGVAENVTFLGHRDRQALQSELAEATCMVLASFQETLPVSVAEAMAAGVPVVSSAVAGLPEMIDDGNTGYLVDGHSPEDLADRVLRILTAPDLGARLGRAAQEKAEAYRPKCVAGKTLEVYKRLAGG